MLRQTFCVYLHRVLNNIPVIKEATKLHLATRVGRRNEHCTTRYNGMGLASAQIRARAWMVNEIRPCCPTAQSAGIRVDDLVPRRSHEYAGFVDNALAMFEMTRILHSGPLSVAPQGGETSIFDGSRHHLGNISHIVADLRIGLQVSATAGDIHNNDIGIPKRTPVLDCHLIGPIDKPIMGRKRTTTDLA